VFACVVLGGASAVLGQASPAPSSAQESPPILEGIVLEGDSAVDAATVILHRVSPDGSGEVDSAPVGPGGEFRFSLPTTPDADIEGDIYFASVDFEGVLYFGPAITTLEQLDTLYVVRVFQVEEVPPEGVVLPLEVRTMFIEFSEEEWVATDLFAIDNRGTRTLVAQEGGIVWSYPLPPGATEPELGEGDMPPDAVTFEGGRVLVTAPLPPGDRLLMIRYRLADLDTTIPAPGSTEVFELLLREPFPPIDVVGLEPVDVVALGPGSSYRRYGANGLVDMTLILVETEEQEPLPLGWLALMASVMLVAGGFLAYARPRRRALAGSAVAGPDPGLSRETLILEVAQIDDALAEATEPGTRSEILERRAALLSLLRKSD
jgi:hypothetical protein